MFAGGVTWSTAQEGRFLRSFSRACGRPIWSSNGFDISLQACVVRTRFYDAVKL